MKDALRVHAHFLSKDWYDFSSGVDKAKSKWSFSATVATRNPLSPYRHPDQWDLKLQWHKNALPVSVCACCASRAWCFKLWVA
jgi:hypothetical protein